MKLRNDHIIEPPCAMLYFLILTCQQPFDVQYLLLTIVYCSCAVIPVSCLIIFFCLLCAWGEKGGGGGETKWVTYGFSLPSYLRVWQLLFRKIFRKILVLIDKFIFSFFTRDFMTLYCNDRIKIKKTLPYLTKIRPPQ